MTAAENLDGIRTRCFQRIAGMPATESAFDASVSQAITVDAPVTGRTTSPSAMIVLVLMSACGKGDGFEEDPVIHTNLQVTSTHETLRCIIEQFGDKHGYEVRYRIDKQPFGDSYIYTITKGNVQIIVDNPFSVSGFEASVFKKGGTEIESRSLGDFAELTHSLKSPNLVCPA